MPGSTKSGEGRFKCLMLRSRQLPRAGHLLPGVSYVSIWLAACSAVRPLCCRPPPGATRGGPSRREQQDVLRPYCSLGYAWDEPELPHRLVLELPGNRKLGTFALDQASRPPACCFHSQVG